MLKTLRKLKARKAEAARLFAAIVARAREPVFFTRLGVADTIDGRFDLLTLHAWLVLDRLREPGVEDLSQELLNTLFVSFEEGMRDIGTGDMSMGRRMRNFADAFYGRLSAYHACADLDALTAAIERNLYRGHPTAHAGEVARYIAGARAHLAGADIASGTTDFGPVP
jgi:cytochrome b pre-mRNA-processing protein 3